jgi:hypothetical protein
MWCVLYIVTFSWLGLLVIQKGLLNCGIDIPHFEGCIQSSRCQDMEQHVYTAGAFCIDVVWQEHSCL